MLLLRRAPPPPSLFTRARPPHARPTRNTPRNTCNTQTCGVALATAGFVIATTQFGIPYNQVFLHHGTLGVVVLAIVYSQVRRAERADRAASFCCFDAVACTASWRELAPRLF